MQDHALQAFADSAATKQTFVAGHADRIDVLAEAMIAAFRRH